MYDSLTPMQRARLDIIGAKCSCLIVLKGMFPGEIMLPNYEQWVGFNHLELDGELPPEFKEGARFEEPID